MPTELAEKRAVVFVDGQNLYHAVRKAFGYPYPNYDVKALATLVSHKRSWRLIQTRFYTGVPKPTANPLWYEFWTRKLAVMGGRQGVKVHTFSVNYHDETVWLSDTTKFVFQKGREKGVDIAIALDLLRMARNGEYDVGVIFSQDQDLAEVPQEVRRIAQEQNRVVEVACAYPLGLGSHYRNGIYGTKPWIKISKEEYDSCIDPRHYGRPGSRNPARFP